VAPGRYDLVASRSGHIPAVHENARVKERTTTGGHHFILKPGQSGSVQGTYFAISSPGITLRIRWNGKYFGIAGVDPDSGSFAFNDVPPGLFEIEAWDHAGPLGTSKNVLVDSGFDSLLEFR